MDYLSSLPYCLVGSVGSILIAKNLLKMNSNNNKLKNIAIIILYTLINCVTFKDNYIPLQTMLKCVALTLTIQQYFGIKIPSAIATSITTIVILMISEILFTINPYLLKNSMIIRSNVYLFTLTNLFIMLIGYLISKINMFNRLINKFLDKFEKDSKYNDLIVLILLISSLAFFCNLIFMNRNVEVNNIALFIFIIILCVLFYIFMYNKNKYNSLIDKYNDLLEYAYTYEEKLDKDKLMRHEHKNQLAVIKGMSKNKKVISYIDELLKNSKDTDDKYIKGLSNIPRGGLRGLIYYKLCLINKKNINYSVDISRNVKKSFNSLSNDDKKVLSYVIGVVLDNALEECENDCNSNIAIEIYKIDKNINIVISNTIINKINLNKIGLKGYTTKGKNHGNGLFLIKKLLNNHDTITMNNKIINNYFVQEIKILIEEKDA